MTKWIGEFPSPLWGGIKGGGRSKVTALAWIQNLEVERPPPLPSPQGGG